MSSVHKGRGKRVTMKMNVDGVSVGADQDGGLRITFSNGDGRKTEWLHVQLSPEHAKSLRDLIGVADHMGPSRVAEVLSKKAV
ncbi:MAG: hypothetical protein PVSMB8_00250 [Vulcanimicrobiaceae bacterium]